MNIEVVAVDGIPMTSSKNVADKFDKQHRQILDNVRKIIETEPEFGRANFCATTYRSDQNKELPCYSMTRDGFAMVAMALTGKEAMKWKVKFISAFNAMEGQLLKQNDSLEWKQARLQSKQARRSFTDVVKEFVQYATDQGSKSASMYYMNITKMEYAALELTEKGQKTPKDFRETLDCMDLCFLATAEQIAKNAIKQGIESGMHYKDIYKLAKERVFTYSETIKLPRLQ